MQPILARTVLILGCACLAFAVGTAGCAEPDTTPVPLTQRLLITYWQQPIDESGRTVRPTPGLDVDGRISDGATGRCDDVRDDERGERPGIDNRYAFLAALLDAFGLHLALEVPAQLQAGEGRYGFDVEPSTEPVGAVYVTLLAFAADAPLELDDELRVRASSELVATPIVQVEATYYEGRWRALFRGLDVPMGRMLGLRPVHDVIVEFEMVEGRFTSAQLGARVSLDTAIAVGVDATGESEAETRDALLSLDVPDLEPDEEGIECAAISFGVGLELEPLPR